MYGNIYDIERTVTISEREYELLKQDNLDLRQQLFEAFKLISELKIEIQLLKNGRKSNTSSTPSSQDYSRTTIKNSPKSFGRSLEDRKDTKAAL